MRKISEGHMVLSVTDATGKGVAGLVKEAEAGRDVVVERRNKPVAAVVGVDRLNRIEQLEEDLLDALVVLTRAVDDTGERFTFDEVLERFGMTREDLDETQDQAA